MLLSELINQIKSELSVQFEPRELENHIYILIEHFLGINKAMAFLEADKEIDPESESKIIAAIAELKLNRPLDYILNTSVFYGREFFVDESVLVPRSETEELVLLVIENEPETNIEIFEIGTGCGCIPISLDLEQHYAKIDACEISKTAIEVARRNAIDLKADVDIFELDILTEIPKRKYDVVVSNPPYVKMEELEGLDKNVIEYEPVIALAPDGEPLTFYKRMISIVDDLLKPGGRFYWEIHEDLGQDVIDLLLEADFYNVKLYKDLYDRDRFVSAVYPEKN